MDKRLDPMQPEHLAQASDIWFEGWRDAHLSIVPKALSALRTHQDFTTRLKHHAPHTRVVAQGSKLLGFAIIKEDELYQFYVAKEARGQGIARLLMEDAETRFREAGYATCWLACSVGNDRAARFYEKSGWQNAGVQSVDVHTSNGPFALDVWRYERDLT